MHRTLLILAVFFAIPATAGEARKSADRVICGSPGGTYRECRVGSGGSIELVSEQSENRCFEGTTWGTRSGGVVWVDRGCSGVFRIYAPEAREQNTKITLRTVTCESADGTRRHCPAESKHGIAIAKRMGEAACVLDETWGFDDEGIWVDKGCSAQFALGGFRLPSKSVPALAVLIKCESIDGNDKECPITINRGIGLVRVLGENACVLNRSWGYHPKGIWVTSDCRAEFAVAR